MHHLAPRVHGLEPEDGEHGAAHAAEVEGVVPLKQEHASARHDVVEDGDEEHDPSNAPESREQRLDDAPESGQRLDQLEHPHQPQQPEDHHGEGLGWGGNAREKDRDGTRERRGRGEQDAEREGKGSEVST